MARLDVKESTLKKLFALSGNLCAFPACTHPVVNGLGDLIGEVCHIEAAEEGGPRYNRLQSDEDRRSFENLLILCPTHHTTTHNVEQYPVERMRQIKSEHETRFLSCPLQLGDAEFSRLCTQATEQLRRRLKRIAVSRLRRGAEKLVGRDKELEGLDRAWANAATHVVSIVAWGGVGKTALAVEWMTRLAARDWPDIEAYFDWSFYSQGTRDQAEASADLFVASALAHFGDPDPQAGSPYNRGERLARLVAEQPALLILDGLEPLQHGPGPLAGQIKDPALATLVKGLAQRPFPGLCVLTSREPVVDLKTFHGKTVDELDLDHLSDQAGAELLHRTGARRAGPASIGPDDAELVAASREVRGHALTLELLGAYLALAHGGDIRRRDRVRFEKADEKTQGGHAFRVIAAYERWLRTEGESGSRQDADRQLAVLRLLGLFDRPADAGCLAALRNPPVIRGLTEPLVDLDDEDWNITLAQLAQVRLIPPDSSLILHPSSLPLDAHPLVREYFARQVRTERPDAWREGHRRLYEHLCASVPHWPEGLAGLQPLYQAVAHGCQAGLQQQACDDVYCDRILRGTAAGGFYSIKKLGAIGADLGAVACFFETLWSALLPNVSRADQAWLLNEAAYGLRALGRLGESLEPMRAGLQARIEQQNWAQAARSASNLSELELTLGDVSAAIRDAEQSVTFADRSSDAYWPTLARTTHADALHHAGRRQESLHVFREAEAMQVKRQPEHPRLYSLQGFEYCDLLLAEAERAAWRVSVGRAPRPGMNRPCTESGDPAKTPLSRSGRGVGGEGVAVEGPATHAKKPDLPTADLLAACAEVAERASTAIEIAERNHWLLNIGLDHLTLGRAALYSALLKAGDTCAVQGRQDARPAEAGQDLAAAVDGLRHASAVEFIARGLITRAWLRFLERDESGSRADLDEVWDIAERGPMPLHQADVLLTRARLFRDPDALAQACQLIQKHGYHRRDEELADAEASINPQA